MPYSCDPNALIADARCFKCITRGMQREVQLYLLCQWANASATPPTPPPPDYPCGAPSNTIQISGAGTAGVNQVYKKTVATGVWTSLDSVFTITFHSAGYGYWELDGPVDGSYYVCQLENNVFPCSWETGDNGDDPSPTGQYIPDSP